MVPLLAFGIFSIDLLTPAGVAGAQAVRRSVTADVYLRPSNGSALFLRGGHGLDMDRCLEDETCWTPIPTPSSTERSARLVGHRRGVDHVQRAQRELRSAQVGQAHAEGLMMKAQEARYYADREAVRAAVDRDEAEVAAADQPAALGEHH